MLLKNFAYQMSGNLGGSFAVHPVKDTTGEITTNSADEKSPGSPSLTSIVSKDAYNTASSGSGTRVWAFAFGTGDTPPTADDYKFSGELIEGLSLINSSGKLTVGTAGASFYATIVNSSEAEITIKELALCSIISSNSSGCIMLTRDVLAEPLILQVGEQKVIQIDVNLSGMLQNIG